MLQDLRFGVLGPVWARRDGIDLAVGQPQQQAVLAMLLFARGRAVSPTELVDGLWGENPPSRAIGAVRNYAYRLRRVIEPDPSKPVILRSAGSGYLLDTKADAVDATQFERLVNDAVRVRDGKENDTAEKASEALRRALALFAGEPLAGVPGPYAHAQRARLIERRLAVLEERIEADLHAGRHAVVAAELSGLLAEHPLRERLLALRMLALYRCGQRTEALNVYTQGRRRFVAELGVEPGRELRELHTRILAGEDPREARQERQPEVVAPQPRAPRPSQLPPETPDFTGRDLAIGRVRDSLLRRLESAVPISVITGLGGVGKTALAVRVAHRIKERFPDGQLYAQLRGMRDRPTPPGVVLNSFLHALGIPDRIIPESVEERSALLRSVLADRRVLIVLDEARDAGQVRPLLPGSPGSAVLITSRAKLAGIVVGKQERTSQKGNRYAFVQMTDASGIYEATVFSERLVEYRELLEPGRALLLTVDVRSEEDNLRLMVAEAQGLDNAVAATAAGLKIYLRDPTPVGGIKQILDRAGKGKGRVQISLDLADLGWETDLTIKGGFAISGAVRSAIKAVPGVMDIQDA